MLVARRPQLPRQEPTTDQPRQESAVIGLEAWIDQTEEAGKKSPPTLLQTITWYFYLDAGHSGSWPSRSRTG
jgi:antibiotic biosynthesis monooxygenase (ABM) superfamily enzyme